MKKQTNEQKVLKALKDHGPLTQAELAKTAKVKNVYQLVAGMVKSGRVRKENNQVVLNDTLGSAPKPEPKATHSLLDFLRDEKERLQDEISVRVHEYAYVDYQLSLLSSEAR